MLHLLKLGGRASVSRFLIFDQSLAPTVRHRLGEVSPALGLREVSEQGPLLSVSFGLDKLLELLGLHSLQSLLLRHFVLFSPGH